MEGNYCKPGELKRKKSGQKTCDKCKLVYNNAAIPEFCTNETSSNETCKNYLGGKFKPATSKLDATMISSTLASVRVNATGQNIRTFVKVGKERKVIFWCGIFLHF